MWWLVYSLSCSVLWGISYVLLSLATESLNNYTINMLYGGLMLVTNLVALAITDGFDNLVELRAWRVSLAIIGHVVLMVATSTIFLLGYRLEGVNSGIYTLISSTYPVVTLIGSYLFLGQRDFNAYYVSFGVILVIAGVSLLALAKN